MKHTFIKIVASVIVSVFTIGGVVYAAGTINITKILGGTSGDTFKLNGKLNTQSLLVQKNVRVKGDLTVDGGLNNIELAAASITYNNDNSGLQAETAQTAIDQLSLTLTDKVNSSDTVVVTQSPMVSLDGSTWTATVHDVWDGEYRETSQIDGEDITITFTPIDETSGTFESSPVNIFHPYEQIEQENNIGTVTGNYNIVGDSMMASDLVGTDISTGSTVQMTIQTDGSMVFEETRVSPPAVIMLVPAS